ncbi:MAG: glycosyltransferase family 9 protein [Rhodospirillales bacterium]
MSAGGAARRIPQRILVIKLGALGDFIQALGPFQAIRRHHPRAHLALLTTPPYAEFAGAAGLFDEIETNGRPAWWRVDRWAHLFGWLNGREFERVYDLQTSSRSSLLFQLFMPNLRPEWSGVARGCSHPHDNPARDRMHTIDRQREQLRIAGIDAATDADFSFLKGDIARFGLPARYVLLAPGGSTGRPAKRWPAERYAVLARELKDRGLAPVVLGGADESALADGIARAGQGLNLAGRTGLGDVAALARLAAGAIGNDTGPMHVVAGVGCPCLVLFSAASDPALCAPRAPKGAPAAIVLRRDNLAALGAAEVAAAMALR